MVGHLAELSGKVWKINRSQSLCHTLAGVAVAFPSGPRPIARLVGRRPVFYAAGHQGILVLWLSDIGDNTVESGGQQQTVHNTILQYRKCTTFSLWSSRNFGSYQGRWCFPLPCTSKLGQPRRNAPGVGSIPFWSLHCCRVVVLSCSLAWGTQFHTRKQYPMLGDDGMDWMIFIRSPSEGWSQAL